MLRIPVTVAALTLAATAIASAQDRTTVSMGAGLATGEGTGTGAAAQVALDLRTPRTPLGLRFDGTYQQWRAGSSAERSGFRASAVSANVVYRLPTAHVRPYALAGVGGYALQGEGLKAGWNVGGGVEVQRGRYSLFGEVRGHFVSSRGQQRLTPFLVGIRF